MDAAGAAALDSMEEGNIEVERRRVCWGHTPFEGLPRSSRVKMLLKSPARLTGGVIVHRFSPVLGRSE